MNPAGNLNLAEQLRDIRDIDVVSAWPPAPGWLLVALAALVLIYLLYRFVRDLRRYPLGSWNRDARSRLKALEARAAELSAREIAGELSELLRRIAIARCGRGAAAGLHGEAWLSWLAQQDPAGFDWLNEGRLLLDLPYAPETDADADKQLLLRLIGSAGAWADSEVRHV